MDLLHIVPFMQPRYYTIASSSNLFPRNIHLLVSVSTRLSPSGVLVQGLCSNFLRQLVPGQKCFVFVKESSFRLPLFPKGKTKR